MVEAGRQASRAASRRRVGRPIPGGLNSFAGCGLISWAAKPEWARTAGGGGFPDLVAVSLNSGVATTRKNTSRRTLHRKREEKRRTCKAKPAVRGTMITVQCSVIPQLTDCIRSACTVYPLSPP